LGGSGIHIMYIAGDSNVSQCKCLVGSWKPRARFSRENSTVYKDSGVNLVEKKIIEAVEVSKIRKKENK